jgi:hypothetical protein
MSIAHRIGVVLLNILILFPAYLLLVISAIMSSVTAADIAKLKDQNPGVKNAHKWVTTVTIMLWLLSAGMIGFSMTLGLVVIPWLVSVPYLYGFIMILFSLLNLAIAGILFYAANVVQKSEDYKNGDKTAKEAFKSSLTIGLLMVGASLFLLGYSVYTISSYYSAGGITGDIVMAAKVAPAIVPEIGAPAAAIGALAQQGLTSGQKEGTAQADTARQYFEQAQKLYAAAQAAQQQKAAAGKAGAENIAMQRGKEQIF